MPGPWDKYAAEPVGSTAAGGAGPWSKYATPVEAQQPVSHDATLPGRPVGAGDVSGAKQWLEQRYGSSAEQPGFWRSLYNTTIGGIKSLVAPPQSGETSPPNPFSVLTGSNALLPAQRIIQGAKEGMVQEGRKTVQEIQAGHPIEATGHALAAVLPLVGPAAAHAGETFASGNIPGGLGEATGLLLPSAVSAFRGGIAQGTKPLQEGLKEGAVRQYTRALSPTTIKNKALAAKVVEGQPGSAALGLPPMPGLIERGIVALTRKGLQSKIGGMVSDLGDQIDQLQAQYPVGAKSLPLEDVNAAIDKGLRDRFTIEVPPTTPNGQTLYVPSGPMAQAGLKIGAGLKRMIELAADTNPATGARTIDYQLLRRFRQNWDSAVADAGGFANKDFVNQAKMGAYKEATNAVRAQLNSATPDIAAINREFHFWKMAQDVIDATVERTAGQSQPLGQQIMRAGGVAAGLAKGGVGSAVLTGEALSMFRKLTTSTGWNTMSAVFKNRLANALAKGNVSAAKTLLRSGLIASGAVNTEQEGSKSLPAPPSR